MAEEKNWLDTLLALGLIGDIYKDLAQQGIKNIGNSIGDTIEFVLTPVKFLKLSNQIVDLHLKRNLQSLAEKYAKIDEDKLISPPSEISVPILERLTYTSSEQIADLFTTLLAKASSAEHVADVHPRFIQIVNSISADEATIIDFLKSTDGIRIIDTPIENKYDTEVSYYLYPRFSDIDTLSIHHPNNKDLYLFNLINLNILNQYNYLTDQQDPTFRNLHNKYAPTFNEIYNKFTEFQDQQVPRKRIGKCTVTDFGRLFIKACTE